MTTLTKPVRRECSDSLKQGRPIMICLLPGGILALRRKGTRTTYEISVGACYDAAAKVYARIQKEERAKLRKARRCPA